MILNLNGQQAYKGMIILANIKLQNQMDSYWTWVSFASDPLFVKKAFAILFAVNIPNSSFARSCKENYIDIITEGSHQLNSKLAT